MSKIEVDAIEPQSGTTLTIGASGDTITIPSGATLTNSGTATGFGKVLQVVSTAKTDTFTSATFNTWTDITGLNVSITPSSASNKIYVIANVNGYAGNNSHIKLVRDSTDICVGASAGSRKQASSGSARDGSGDDIINNNSLDFLDSPNTTSSVTYKIQFWLHNSQTFYLNRSLNDTDAAYSGRSASTITVMEIAG